ncbi:CFEM domain-containing protein [Fusarium keratoplasticum]|nr:CFEM domain-containing protein [Fusarium keratoplasticum]
MQILSVTVVSALRLRFLVAFGNSINPTRDGYATCYWSIIELNVAVCCVCMPNLRLLLLRVFPRLGGSSARQLSEAQYDTAASRRKNSRAAVSGDQSDNDLHAPAYYSSNPSIDRSSTTELVELGIRPTSKGMNVV